MAQARADNIRTIRLRTIGELFDHLYAERKTRIARSTHSRECYRLALWRDTLGNEVCLTSLTPAIITTALERIAAKTSPGTANSALGVLKTYLNWAGNVGLLPFSQHKTVRPLRDHRASRHHRDWWTIEEITNALAVAAQDLHQPSATLLVACGCYLGLRVEENIMLRWQDFSLDALDQRSGQPRPVCHITPHDDWQPKNGEARDIPVSAQLLAILKMHRRTTGYLLMPEPSRPGRPRGGTGWIYRYDPRALWTRVMKAVTVAGGKPITMYGMRHSFASNLLIHNVSDVKVSRWMGHADTRMIHRHYGHLLSYDGDIDALAGLGKPQAKGEPTGVAFAT